MSTTTLTLSTAADTSTNGPSQSTPPTSSSSGVSTLSSTITATTPTKPHSQQPTIPPKPTSTAPPSPPSRPSTPPTPTTIPKQLTSSKRLNRLSHISIATWIGVGLTLAGLVVAVYYGIPMLRLAIWTAKNDFREACKSELEAALPQTATCNETLRQPPLPPPIRKRMIKVMHEHSVWGIRLVGVMVFGTVLLLALRRLVRWSRTNLEQPEAQTKVLERLFQGALAEQEHTDALLTSRFSNAPLHEARKGVGFLPGVSDTAEFPQSGEGELHAELEADLMDTAEPSDSQEKTGSSAVQAHSSQETLEMASTFIQDVRPSRPTSEDVSPLDIASTTSKQVEERQPSPSRSTSTRVDDAAIATIEKSRDGSEVRIPAVAAGKQGSGVIVPAPAPLIESSRKSIRDPKEVVRRWKSLVALARHSTYDNGWRALGCSSADGNLPLVVPGNPKSVIRPGKNLKGVFVVAIMMVTGLVTVLVYPFCADKIHEVLRIVQLEMIPEEIRIFVLFTPTVGLLACLLLCLDLKSLRIQAISAFCLAVLVATFILGQEGSTLREIGILESCTVLFTLAMTSLANMTRRELFVAITSYYVVFAVFLIIYGA